MESSEETQADLPSPTRAHELARGELVGRYVVLEQLGAGAMGVVWAAYDPDLDRKIAIKLLRMRNDGDADPLANRRLLREAQALARLSHPNVVAVHDVGLHDRHVFLAMEFVEGRTIAEWLKQRPPWREVLGVFVRAGDGLAAAHERGLVHRDFKPSNLMLGHDGRVRVMDFGVALSREDASISLDPQDEPLAASSRKMRSQILIESTATDAMLGTPAYMAPEQFSRAEIDAASDQFSFCVALWEGLYGRRPFAGDSPAQLVLAVTQGTIAEPPSRTRVPTWIRRVLERGLAVDPRARHPSMRALLDALRRDPTRRRRTIAWSSAVAVAIAGAIVGQRMLDARALAACTAQADAIDDAWNADRSHRVQAAMLATDLPYASSTFERVAPRLDDYAQAWRTSRAELCRMRDATVWADASSCIEEARVAFEAVIEVLADSDRAAVQDAITAIHRLPELGSCTSPEALARRPALPDGPHARQAMRALTRIDALVAAGRSEEALAEIEALIADPEAMRAAPISARAHLRRAEIEPHAKASTRAAALRDAFNEALAIGDDATASEAAMKLAFVVGDNEGRPDDGVVWDEIATTLQTRMGVDPDHDHRFADRLATRGMLEGRRAHYDAAIAAHARALAIRERIFGPDHPDVAASHLNLGLAFMLHGDSEAAEREATLALECYERTFGPEHPRIVSAINNLAATHLQRGQIDAAESGFRRVANLRERLLGPEHPMYGRALANLGSVSSERDDHAEALELHRRALAIFENALGPQHPDVADQLHNVGSELVALGDYESAREHLHRAIAVADEVLGPDHPSAIRARTQLAEIQLAQNDPQARVSLTDTLAVAERVLAPQSREIERLVWDLVRAEHDHGDASLALAYALWDLGIRIQSRGLSDPTTAESLATLAELAKTPKRPRR